MINKDIVDYIKAERQKGRSDESIKQSLNSVGWQVQDIEEAIKLASLNNAIPFPAGPANLVPNISIAAGSIYAGFWKRAFAYIIDIIILSILGLIISFLLRSVFLNFGENLWYIGFIILGLYFVPLNSSIGKGQTLGKKLLKIRIVRKNGQFLTVVQSFSRYFILSLLIFNSGMAKSIYSLSDSFHLIGTIFVVLIICMFLGIIGILIFTKDKRGLHDYLVGTVVVNSKKVDDIALPEVASFKESIASHKTLFIISIIALTIILVAGIILSSMLLKTSVGGVNFGVMLNLKNDLEKDFPVSDVSIESQWQKRWDWSGKEVADTQDLVISGYLKYQIYSDENKKNQLAEQMNQKVISTYPDINNFNNVVIAFRTGYDLGFTNWINISDNKVFPIDNVYLKSINSARDFIKERKFSESLLSAEKALTAAKTDKEKSAAHYWIGLSYYKVSNIKGAETEYQRALSLDPRNESAHSSMSAVYYSNGKFDAAIEFAEKAISINPDYAWPHSNLGLAYIATGRLPEAVEELKIATKIDPSTADFHLNLGSAYMAGNQAAEAIDEYNKTIALDPNFAGAYYGLALAYQKLGKMDDFENNSKLAIKVSKNYSIVYLTLFDHYASLNRAEDLKVLFSQYSEANGRTKEQVINEIKNTQGIQNKDKILEILNFI